VKINPENKEKQAVVLLGSSGVGKTLLTLNMCGV
jgi:ABC-type sugar transport system ATPase subunit